MQFNKLQLSHSSVLNGNSEKCAHCFLLKEIIQVLHLKVFTENFPYQYGKAENWSKHIDNTY